MVALTFDDGPNESATPRILDVLEARGVPATFFVFGERASRHPEVVERMLGAGHSIQPHCWAGHARHQELSRAELTDDIERTLDALERLGCPPARLWRPPHGDISDPDSYEVAAAHGLELVTWTLQTCDWQDHRSANHILAEIDEEARDDVALRPDSVILMHDLPGTAALAAGLLDRIEARGYEAGLLSAGSAAAARGGDYRYGRQDGKLPCGLAGVPPSR